MRRDVDAAIQLVAQHRAGAFGMEHVAAAGGDRWLAKRRLDAGRWLGEAGGPFVLAGTPDSLDRRRHVALLALGPTAVLTHQSAGELHRLDGVWRGLVVVSIRHRRRYADPPGVTVHRIDDLRPSHLTSMAGFPTTTVPRTLLDLAAVTSDRRVQAAVESAITDHKASFTAIATVLQQTRRQGKTGVGRLVRVLDHLDGEPPPASVLERHLAVVLQRAGLTAARQYPLPWSKEPVTGCVDVAIPEAMVIVEADGRRWHARYDAMARDRRRDREVLRAGWVTVRFVYKDLVDDPDGAADELAAIVAGRVA